MSRQYERCITFNCHNCTKTSEKVEETNDFAQKRAFHVFQKAHLHKKELFRKINWRFCAIISIYFLENLVFVIKSRI